MIKAAVAALVICGTFQTAQAQMSAAPIRSALPHSSSIALNNAAGALQYCASKRLVSSTIADAVFEHLTKERLVTKSADFAAGASGEIIGDRKFSISSAPRYLQSQACDLALKRVKEFVK